MSLFYYSLPMVLTSSLDKNNKNYQEKIVKYMLEDNPILKGGMATPKSINKSRANSKAFLINLLDFKTGYSFGSGSEDLIVGSLHLSNINPQNNGTFRNVSKMSANESSVFLHNLKEKSMSALSNSSFGLKKENIPNINKSSKAMTHRGRSKSSVFKRLYQNARVKSKTSMLLSVIV